MKISLNTLFKIIELYKKRSKSRRSKRRSKRSRTTDSYKNQINFRNYYKPKINNVEPKIKEEPKINNVEPKIKEEPINQQQKKRKRDSKSPGSDNKLKRKRTKINSDTNNVKSKKRKRDKSPGSDNKLKRKRTKINSDTNNVKSKKRKRDKSPGSDNKSKRKRIEIIDITNKKLKIKQKNCVCLKKFHKHNTTKLNCGHKIHDACLQDLTIKKCPVCGEKINMVMKMQTPQHNIIKNSNLKPPSAPKKMSRAIRLRSQSKSPVVPRNLMSRFNAVSSSKNNSNSIKRSQKHCPVNLFSSSKKLFSNNKSKSPPKSRIISTIVSQPQILSTIVSQNSSI